MRVLFAALLIAGSAVQAQSVAEGQAAWDRIYAVASHPRCTNCHVGAQDAPMWEGLSYRAGAVHGMGVKADESRIGAESMPCRTCHVSALGRDVGSPGPPQIDEAWRLPPVEIAWLGASPTALCAQLGALETSELATHLRSSAFVAWGFAPGPGRDAPTGSPARMARDIEIWAAAGRPCE